jgi:hypothetical protein
MVLDHRRITLTVRPGASPAATAEVMHNWHKALLHRAVPPLIRKWELKLGVKVNAYFLQRMKTKWGRGNHRAGHIRHNTELVKKPKDLLEYVLSTKWSICWSRRIANAWWRSWTTLRQWREARSELNGLPLAARRWNEARECNVT